MSVSQKLDHFSPPPTIVVASNGADKACVGTPEEDLARKELYQIRHSKVFSPSYARQELLSRLMVALQNSFCSDISTTWDKRFGDPDELCNICSNLPLLPRVIETPGHSSIALALSDKSEEYFLGSFNEVQSRTWCALCRIVSAIILKDRSLGSSKTAREEPCILRPAIGTFRTYLDPRHVADVYLGSDPVNHIKGHISYSRYCHIPPNIWYRGAATSGTKVQRAWSHCCSNIIAAQNARDQRIDFQQIKSWVELCERGHGRTCGKQAFASDIRKAVKLVLIDVVENRLVQADSSFRYITLSYVWGGANKNVTMINNFNARCERGGLDAAFSEFPAVIQDAWRVVLGLQERYLWIDSLCIKQNDDLDLAEQIPQMDRVYNQALLTIVAMSGISAASSLPGIAPNSRTPIHPTERTTSWIFTAEPPTLDRILAVPCYETRAWTYQERLLSNRRLFLTDWQMYFQCYRFVFQESYPAPRQIVQVNANMKMDGGQRSQFLLSHSRLSRSTLWSIANMKLTRAETKERFTLIEWEHESLRMYDQIVRNLSARDLFVEEEILEAFKGIVSHLESHRAGPFCEGIPMQVLDRALLWVPSGKFQRRKCKNQSLQIPSWSWCSWKGGFSHMWATFGILSEALFYDYRRLQTRIQDFFIEDSEMGSFSRVERCSFDTDDPSTPSKKKAPGDLGIHPLRIPGKFLHFHALVIPANRFSIKGGQLTKKDTQGEWDLDLSAEDMKISSLGVALEGVCCTMESYEKDDIKRTSTIFRQRPTKFNPDEEKDPRIPATRMRPRRGGYCAGYLLGYEDDSSHFFTQAEDCLLVLLSVNNLQTEKVKPVIQKARGDRYLLWAYAPRQDNWQLGNVLLVKKGMGERKHTWERVGIGMMLMPAFEEEGPEQKYLVLG
ncbi:heterokaryon incompatibility protein-domain-containing protein [Bisporella sp. PMI_857]|nr:heterokaryon incompatibility protein-domain-containing protein [Bisporella sp. PMI_857]